LSTATIAITSPVARMMTLAGYYLIICILFLGLAVYNAIFYSGYSSDKCIISTVVESGNTTST